MLVDAATMIRTSAILQPDEIRAFTRRWDRPVISDKPSAEISARLERIEQAVEAVAIEVERIAEAQRFSAKLMSEQQRSLPKSDAAR